MIRFTGILILFSGIALAAPTPAAQALPTNWTLNADQGSGTVEFDAVGRPSALKIHGKGNQAKGNLQGNGKTVSGTLSFDLESLETGINMRNEHMKKKYLETDKFPKATLDITNWTIPDSLIPAGTKAEDVPFDGTLTLHGVKKPVSGKAKIEHASGDQVKVLAVFPLKISDYNIDKPGYAGITMAEDVTITVNMTAPILATTAATPAKNVTSPTKK